MISEANALKVNLYTVIAVYFLILVGGIVRSTGAGMGCPDWPKCFDSYVPPSTETALPIGYESYYVEARQKKNARLSSVLNSIGFSDLADKVNNDPTISEVTKYDVTKAWIEYINRLIGVLIGLFIILNAAQSFKYWSKNRAVTLLALISFILVIFQGWLGSLVVSTNLLPGFISFHMILALVLVATLLWQRYLMLPRNESSFVGSKAVLVLLVLFLIQIVLGVEVRESVDLIKNSMIDRGEWIESLGLTFYIHRSYSLVILFLIGFIYYKNRLVWKQVFALKALTLVILLEIISGAVMAYFEIPAFVQPVHLILGSLAFGAIFYLFLDSNFKKINS
ncbi:MAG: COX15/CtaA family protein [Cyclobacteriaceae bacterium]